VQISESILSPRRFASAFRLSLKNSGIGFPLLFACAVTLAAQPIAETVPQFTYKVEAENSGMKQAIEITNTSKRALLCTVNYTGIDPLGQTKEGHVTALVAAAHTKNKPATSRIHIFRLRSVDAMVTCVFSGRTQ